MKIVKKLLMVVITVLLVVLVAFNIYNFFSLKVLKNKLTSVGGYALLEVVSGSMEPTIHIGDMIVINTKESNYQENDIVTFMDVNGSFVTHRIIYINGEEMITKGDFNDTEDEPTSMNKLVGKYVFKIPSAGKIISSFRSPLVMMMILVIGILFCYLISTDKNGKPLLTEDEKEFKKFQEYQEQQEENQKEEREKREKTERIQKEKESLEKEIETLFEEKRNINKQIRILLEKKATLENTQMNVNSNNSFDKKNKKENR